MTTVPLQNITPAKEGEIWKKEMDGIDGKNRRYTSKERGTFQRAIENHDENLKVAKEIGDRTGEGRAYGNLSNAYQSQGDYQKAID